MTGVRVLSPAKINLGLEIVGKRDDGYHEIRTLLIGVGLFDTITARAAGSNVLSIDDPQLSGADNLALRAALRWSEVIDPRHRSMALTIEKRIPAAAGLGGASGNAASVLRLGNALYDLRPDADLLHGLAAQLGSDVPFFLGGPAALASGRGEILEPLPPIAPMWLVLATANVSIERKTVTMYRALRRDDFSSGSRVMDLADQVRGGGAIGAGHFFNAFERPLLAMFPELEVIPGNMRSLGASRTGLSGAGPTWYALMQCQSEAKTLAGELQEGTPGIVVNVVPTLDHLSVIERESDRNASDPSGV